MSMQDIIGDYQAFFALQRRRLNDIHIDISGCEISHLAYRTETCEEYLRTREKNRAALLVQHRKCLEWSPNVYHAARRATGSERWI